MGRQPSDALRGLVLTTTVVVTAVVAASHGLAGRDDGDFLNFNEFGSVAAAALLFIGVPAVFMWFNTVRVLRGSVSVAWRVKKHLTVVTTGLIMIGIERLLLTAQFAALGFVAGAFVVVVARGTPTPAVP